MATQPQPSPAQQAPAEPATSPHNPHQTGSPPPITTATAPTAAHWQSQSPIPDALLRRVYASDQAMYPAAPSYERLRAWVDACPDLALYFTGRFRDRGSNSHGRSRSGGGGGEDAEAAGPVAGVVIVLPLKRRHWEDLLCGRIKEKDVDPVVMFPSSALGGGGGDSGDSCEEVEEVGLHVYHIERFETVLEAAETEAKRKGGFSEYALEEVMRQVQARFSWKVVGMSALTATPAGKKAFERLGFAPTGYRELFVEMGADVGSAIPEKQQMEMICVYPGDESTLDEPVGGAPVDSMSEMSVKYYGSSMTWSSQGL